MTTHEILHIIRNPLGKSEEEVRQARIDAADLIEQLERDIVELKEARERESERLDWLLAKLGDKTLSLVIGELPVDVGYWRDRIDKAKRYGN